MYNIGSWTPRSCATEDRSIWLKSSNPYVPSFTFASICNRSFKSARDFNRGTKSLNAITVQPSCSCKHGPSRDRTEYESLIWTTDPAKSSNQWTPTSIPPIMKYHVGLLSFTPTRQLRMNYSSRRIAHWPILTTLKPLGCCEEQPSPSTKGYILVCLVPLLRQKQNGYLKTNSFPFLPLVFVLTIHYIWKARSLLSFALQILYSTNYCWDRSA